MKIYTVQPIDVLIKVINHGILYSDPITYGGDPEIDFFLKAYKWLIPQMHKRIPSNHIPENTYPWWGWYRYSETTPKPKFSHANYRNSPETISILSLDIPDNYVLLSDYDAWHHVLNDAYLGFDYEEKAFIDDLCRNCGLDKKKFKYLINSNQLDSYPEYKERFRETWERIFDLDFTPRLLRYPKKRQYVQGTFWELRKEHIEEVKIKGGRIDKTLTFKKNKLGHVLNI